MLLALSIIEDFRYINIVPKICWAQFERKVALQAECITLYYDIICAGCWRKIGNTKYSCSISLLFQGHLFSILFFPICSEIERAHYKFDLIF
jgi:hypothetical protein